MRAAGDPWLHQRAERTAELFDGVRVDHVVGLYRTYVRPIDKSPPYRNLSTPDCEGRRPVTSAIGNNWPECPLDPIWRIRCVSSMS